MVSEDQLLSRDWFSGEIWKAVKGTSVTAGNKQQQMGLVAMGGYNFSPKGVHAMKTETLKTRFFSKHQ